MTPSTEPKAIIEEIASFTASFLAAALSRIVFHLGPLLHSQTWRLLAAKVMVFILRVREWLNFMVAPVILCDLELSSPNHNSGL